MNYVRLKNEVIGDPLARGYAGMSDQEVVDDGATEYRTCPVDLIPGWKIFNATDDEEYAALSADQQARWDRLCNTELIDIANGIAKAREVELFGPGTQTRSNLQELKNPLCSRWTELGLVDVDKHDIAYVRAQ